MGTEPPMPVADFHSPLLRADFLCITLVLERSLHMGTASGSDYGVLTRHKFFPQRYSVYQKRLIELAKQSYLNLTQLTNILPQQSDFAPILEMDLVGSVVFVDLVVDVCVAINFPNSADPYWPDFFAGPVARFMVDNDWDEIVA